MLHIIILAAGRGSRFGSDLPKQFCLLGNRPVIMHTITRMQDTFPNAQVWLTLAPEFDELWSRMCRQFALPSPTCVSGGNTRAESVRNAILAIKRHGVEDNDVIMIHDGARPVVPADMLSRIFAAIEHGAEAAIPAVPVTDSLRKVADGGASEVVDRSTLVAVQTPQAFRASVIIPAYLESDISKATDDACVYQSFTGKAPVIVAGAPTNIKITNPRDIDVAALHMDIK